MVGGRNLVGIAAVLGSAGAALAQVPVSAPIVEAIQSEPTQLGGASKAIIVVDGDRPFIVGTAELAGLELASVSTEPTDLSNVFALGLRSVLSNWRATPQPVASK